jgi:hypothetical protein
VRRRTFFFFAELFVRPMVGMGYMSACGGSRLTLERIPQSALKPPVKTITNLKIAS